MPVDARVIEVRYRRELSEGLQANYVSPGSVDLKGAFRNNETSAISGVIL